MTSKKYNKQRARGFPGWRKICFGFTEELTFAEGQEVLTGTLLLATSKYSFIKDVCCLDAYLTKSCLIQKSFSILLRHSLANYPGTKSSVKGFVRQILTLAFTLRLVQGTGSL